MKRIITALLISVLLFNVYSCNNAAETTDITTGNDIETTETGVRYKPYKYGNIGGDYLFARDTTGAPVKYNVHDGKMSYVCPDPFCSHHYGECPFMGCEFFAIGNIVYFTKQDENTGKGSVCSFDVNSMDIKTVYSCSGYLNLMFSYEYRLLLRYITSNNYNATGYYIWYDTKTEKVEILDEDDIPKNYEIYEVKDDRIVWYIPEREEYYSTDLNGKDLKEYNFLYAYGNSYKYEIEEENGKRFYSLYVTFNGESEKKLFLKDIGPCFFYENKIVYFKTVPYEEQKVVHVYEDGMKDTDEFGGDVYVINPDGTDNHLLFHTDEFLIGGTEDNKHPQVCGDYFGLLAAEYEGDTMKEDKLIIANINTGEFVVTHK